MTLQFSIRYGDEKKYLFVDYTDSFYFNIAVHNWIYIGVSKCVDNTGLYKYSITNDHEKVIV